MVRYEWDETKRERNLEQRGLDFADAHLVYENPAKRTLASPRDEESRLFDIAMVERLGAILVLIYLERGDVVRVISFRKASRKERRVYVGFREQD